jgi:transcription factor E
MLDKFLKEVVIITVGKYAEEIADLLNTKKHVNEFLIAKKLDITINQTRNILYKLSDHGLVSSIRKKDKKKGWYTYFWKIETLKALEFLKEIKKNRINQIQRQINSRETKEFYVCERCNIEFNEETALLHNFTCMECGEIFTRKDNTKMLRELKKISDKLGKEVGFINQEIEKEKEKIEKKKAREEAKIKKEKAKKRAKKRAAKKRAEKKKKPAKKKKAKKKKIVKKKKLKKKAKPAKKKKTKKKTKKRKSRKKIIKKKSKKKPAKKKKAVKKKPKKKK